MDLGGYTATGPRETNEDRFFSSSFPEVHAFTNGIIAFMLVSDGMGGYLGGDIASQLTVSAAENYIGKLLTLAAGEKQIELDAPYALTEISQIAHENILNAARESNRGSMGATFVAAFLSKNHAWIGHVGDSRAYLIRNGGALRITEDHSQVGRMLSQGLITEQEAQHHPARNRIERALGFSDATPELNEIELQANDMLMLCSDGVYTALNSQAIAEYAGCSDSAEHVARSLVEHAVRAGSDDNATAVVALNNERQGLIQSQKRSTIPTIRTQAINALPAGRRPTQRQSRQRRALNKSGGLSRQLIPLVLVVAALVLGGAVLFNIFMQPPDAIDLSNGDASQPYDSSASSPMGDSSLGNGVSQDGSISPEFATFTVDYDTTLKYVDKDGLAHRFDEDIFSAPNVSVLADHRLLADENAGAYGYEDYGNSYRVLAGAYYDDLLRDVALYQRSSQANSNADIAFDSSLSELIDPEEYRMFLEALSDAGITRASDIQYLALDSDALSQENP